MSRIGKKSIVVPDKVEIKVDGDLIIVRGPKGELKLNLVPEINIKHQDQELSITVKDESIKQQRSNWGTYHQLITNMVAGVSDGFSKQLEVNGVGYRIELKGQQLILNLGFSHPVEFNIPQGIEISLEKNIITVSGIDKQLVGETAAQIRRIKKPEPYKGKGIKYADEVIRRKAGKQAKGVGGPV